MRLINPKQAIHDAYASKVHALPVVSVGVATGRASSTLLAADQAVANLVINKVENQPAHLKAIAVYCFAPGDILTEREINQLQIKLWIDFVDNHKSVTFTSREQVQLLLLSGFVIKDFRIAAHTGNAGESVSFREMALALGFNKPSELHEHFGKYRRSMENMLAGYLKKAIKPLSDMIKEVNEAVPPDKLEDIYTLLKEHGITRESCALYIRSRFGVDKDHILSLTWEELDEIENQVEYVVKLRKRLMADKGKKEPPSVEKLFLFRVRPGNVKASYRKAG